MSYQIDAYVERGIPVIRLLDEHSGEARLQWRQPAVKNDAVHLMAWRMLFKQLVLLSSAQRTPPDRGERIAKVNRQRRKPLSALTLQQGSKKSAREENMTTGNVVYLPVRQLQAR